MNQSGYGHGLDSFQQILFTDSGDPAPIPFKVITDRGGATHDANLLKCGIPIGEAQDRYSPICAGIWEEDFWRERKSWQFASFGALLPRDFPQHHKCSHGVLVATCS